MTAPSRTHGSRAETERERVLARHAAVTSKRAAGELTEYLRSGREARGMSLCDVSRITRIPERSLERLERGDYHELPADVFVRGFVKSYARCVGLDGDEALRRYSACGIAAAPVSAPAVDGVLNDPFQDGAGHGVVRPGGRETTPARPHAHGHASAAAVATAARRSTVVADDAPATDGDDAEPEARPQRSKRNRIDTAVEDVSRSLRASAEVNHRGALTLAVIILVIVATLTMSYLLRRPSTSGDGVTRLPTSGAVSPERGSTA